MVKDVFHQQVKNALIKDGWIITNDPLYIRISDAVKVQIDLAAESAIAAERDTEKIAVEIKSFIAASDVNEFHTVLGQYLNYCQALEENESDRIVYLAVPHETYLDFFQLAFVQRTLQRYPSGSSVHSAASPHVWLTHQVKLVTYDPKKEEIRQWIK